MEQAEDAHMHKAEQGGQASVETESVSVDAKPGSVTASTAASSTTSNEQFDVVDSHCRPRLQSRRRRWRRRKNWRRS
jgi:hypothetical protein